MYKFVTLCIYRIYQTINFEFLYVPIKILCFKQPTDVLQVQPQISTAMFKTLRVHMNRESLLIKQEAKGKTNASHYQRICEKKIYKWDYLWSANV